MLETTQATAQFSWSYWHFHPDVVIGLLSLEGLYLLGVHLARKQLEHSSDREGFRLTLFSIGVLTLYVSLTSPIHHLSDSFLFSAHMVQHLLIMLVAPPLLIAGISKDLLLPLAKLPKLLTFARLLTHPIIAFSIFTFILSFWHLPTLYDLTLRNHTIHIIEHILFIAAAVIMWWPILSPFPQIPKTTYPIQMVYLFFLSLPPGFIGAAITFSDRILYSYYGTVPRLWEISALTDQQIGGLIMKVPGGFVFLGALTIVFFIWFNREERTGN